MSGRPPPTPPRLRRGGPLRQPRLRVYIFAEGKRTEPIYFESFAAEHGNSLVEVICDGGGVPATLVDRALAKRGEVRRSRNSFEEGDQIWVVFDEDEHPLVAASIARALGSGIRVGYSNPCFEVWLLLHYADHDAPDDRHVVQSKLAAVDNGYDAAGAKTPTYDALSVGYAAACGRAERMRLRRQEEQSPRGRPFTNVDLLTAIIVQNGKPRC